MSQQAELWDRYQDKFHFDKTLPLDFKKSIVPVWNWRDSDPQRWLKCPGILVDDSVHLSPWSVVVKSKTSAPQAALTESERPDPSIELMK